MKKLAALFFAFLIPSAMPLADAPPVKTQALTIKAKYPLGTLKDGALESLKSSLPAGSVILALVEPPPSVHEVHGPDGKLLFSSTGYVKIFAVEKSPSLSDEEVSRLNALPGGLYISSVAVQELVHDEEQDFPPLKAKVAENGYLKFFNPNGKPKLQYTTLLKKRFPQRFNGAATQKSLPAAEQEKWDRLYEQLKLAGDRTKTVPRELFMIDTDEARRRSRAFETNKIVSLYGAWSIAVLGTAKRHGFQHVPCAEFMSETIRQAYARAGYSHFQDFNDKKRNRLDFKNGAAAVEMLAIYLHRAGWIPWDSANYVPMVGAVAMHRTARTPGHTYMIAGDNGRFIMDNGRPQGRDLRETPGRTIEIMYQHGVFFLPPGRTPQKWPSPKMNEENFQTSGLTVEDFLQ